MKDIEFVGRSLQAIREFNTTAKREAGYQLDRVQRGFDPTDWKPMPLIGQGVREIRIQEDGQWRIIYIAKFKNTVHVLHAFHKKTQKTSKLDIVAAKRAFKEIVER